MPTTHPRDDPKKEGSYWNLQHQTTESIFIFPEEIWLYYFQSYLGTLVKPFILFWVDFFIYKMEGVRMEEISF